MKACPRCGSSLRDEDVRCGVCGNLYSETEERRVEKNPIEKSFAAGVRKTRILLVTSIIALGFAIAAIVGSGFGSLPIFIIGIGSLLYAIWMIPNLLLGGYGKGSRAKMLESRAQLRASKGGYILLPANDTENGRATETRKEERHEDSEIQRERKQEDFD